MLPCCRYEGTWSKGVREGQGKCKYPNGDLYDGAWSCDVRAGLGTCAFENGDKYTGALSTIRAGMYAIHIAKHCTGYPLKRSYKLHALLQTAAEANQMLL